MNVKEEGEWSIVCDEPIDELKSIISNCKGVAAQLEESLERELQLQESVGVLELDLSRLSEEIQEINALQEMGGEKGSVEGIIEAIKTKRSKLNDVEKTLTEKSDNFSEISKELPDLERRSLNESITRINSDIESQREQLIKSESACEKYIKLEGDICCLDQEFSLISEKVAHCQSLPIEDRENAITKLEEKVIECLDVTGRLAKEFKTDFDPVPVHDLEEKVERLKVQALQFRNEIAMARNENDRFGKAFYDIKKQLNDMEVDLDTRLCMVEKRENDRLEDAIEELEIDKKNIVEEERKLGELTGRLAIVGEVATKDESIDCEGKIEDLRRLCQERKGVIDTRLKEMYEIKRRTREYTNHLDKYLRRISDFEGPDTSGADYGLLQEKMNSNDELSKELVNLQKEIELRCKDYVEMLKKLPLREKSEVELQTSNVLDRVSSCITSMNNASHLLKKKADIANRLNDARQEMEDLGEILDDMKEGTDLKLIVETSMETDLRVSKCEEVIKCVESEIDGAGLEIERVEQAMFLKDCESLSEELATLKDRIVVLTKAHERDLNSLTSLLEAVESIREISGKINEAFAESETGLDIASQIELLQNLVNEADIKENDALKIAENVGEISFEAVLCESQKAIEEIKICTEEVHRLTDMLFGRIKDMEKTEENMKEFLRQCQVLVEELDDDQVLAGEETDLEELRKYQYDCEQFKKLLDKLESCHEDMSKESVALVPKCPRKDQQKIQSSLDELKSKISLKKADAEKKIRDNRLKITYLGEWRSLTSEINQLRLSSDETGCNEELTTSRIDLLIGNHIKIPEARLKISELRTLFEREDIWKAETAEVLRKESKDLEVVLESLQDGNSIAADRIMCCIKDQVRELQRSVENMKEEMACSRYGGDEDETKLKGSKSKIAAMLEENLTLKEMALAITDVLNDEGQVLNELQHVEDGLKDLSSEANRSFENISFLKSAILSYEEDLSKLSQQLEELKNSESEKMESNDISALKSNNSESLFVLQQIGEALQMIQDDEKEFFEDLTEEKRHILLGIMSEFLEDFNFLKGKLETESNKLDFMEREYSYVCNKIEEIATNIDDTSNAIEIGENNNPEERFSFLQEKLQILDDIENDIQSLESECKNLLTSLPENESRIIDLMFKKLNKQFEVVVDKIGNEQQNLDDLAENVLLVNEQFGRLTEDLKELEGQRTAAWDECDIESLLSREKWMLEKLDFCEEEVDAIFAQYEEGHKSIGKYYNITSSKDITESKAEISEKIRTGREAVNQRVMKLEDMKNRKNRIKEIFEGRRKEVHNIEKCIGEFEKQPYSESKRLSLIALQKQLGCVSAGEGEDIFSNEDVKDLPTKDREEIENDVLDLAKKKNILEKSLSSIICDVDEIGSKISGTVDKVSTCNENLMVKAMNFDMNMKESFEKGYEGLRTLKDALDAATTDYEALKSVVSQLEKEVGDANVLDESILALEQNIVKNEQLIGEKTEKIKEAEEKYERLFTELDNMQNSLVFEGFQNQEFDNFEKARKKYVDLLAALEEIKTKQMCIGEKVEVAYGELPSHEAEELRKLSEKVGTKIKELEVEMQSKIKMLDVIRKELGEIERQMKVNLTWIAIAKTAVTSKSKDAKSMEELLNERNRLIEQIESLDEEVGVIFSIGYSMCERLPEKEREGLLEMLHEVKENWEGVKTELSDERGRLDASISERDSLVTAIASCMMRIDDLEKEFGELQSGDFENESFDKSLLDIKEQLKSLNADKESLFDNSKEIFKRVTDMEKEMYTRDVENINKRLMAIETMVNDSQEKCQVRASKLEKLTQMVETVEVNSKESFALLDDVTKLVGSLKIAKENMKKTNKNIDWARIELEKVCLELETEECAQKEFELLRAKTEEERLRLGEIVRTVEDCTQQTKEIEIVTEELTQAVAQLNADVNVVNRCISGVPEKDLVQNIRDLRIEIEKTAKLLSKSNIFYSDNENLIAQLRGITTTVNIAERTIQEIVENRDSSLRTESRNLGDQIQGFTSRLEGIRDATENSICKELSLQEKVDILRKAISELQTLKTEVSKKLPKIFTLAAGVEGTDKIRFEDSGLRLQEGIVQLKTEFGLKLIAFENAMSQIEELEKTFENIEAKFDGTEQVISAAVACHSFQSYAGKLNELKLVLDETADGCIKWLKTVDSNLPEVNSKSREVIALRGNELLERIKARRKHCEDELDVVCKIDQSIAVMNENKDISNLKDSFERRMTNVTNETTTKKLAEELRTRLNIVDEAKSCIANVMNDVQNGICQYSKECIDSLELALVVLGAAQEELMRELSLLDDQFQEYVEIAQDKDAFMLRIRSVDDGMTLNHDADFYDRKIAALCSDYEVLEKDFTANERDEIQRKIALYKQQKIDQRKKVLSRERDEVVEMVNVAKLGELQVEMVFPEDFFAADDTTFLGSDDKKSGTASSKVENKDQITEITSERRRKGDVNFSSFHEVDGPFSVVSTSSNVENQPVDLVLEASDKKRIEPKESLLLHESESALQRDNDGIGAENISRKTSNQSKETGAEEDSAQEDYGSSSLNSSLSVKQEAEVVAIPERSRGSDVIRRRSYQSMESGLDSLLPLDEIVDRGNALSDSLSSLEVGFEEEEERVYGFIKEASSEVSRVDELLASLKNPDYKSIESLQKSLETLQVIIYHNIFVSLF